MSKDKRKSERMSSSIFANLESITQESLGRGVVLDVSMSGFGVETEADLQIDGEIICHMEIPLTIRAQVVRRIKNGQIKRYGLRFVGQGFFDKLMMKKVLEGPIKTRKVE